MHRRCLKVKFKDYPRYGGSGISICPQWLHNFANFLRDMGPAPGPEYWLGRRDTEGHYTPDNTMWTLPTPQKRRKRCCRMVTVEGVVMTVTEASRLPGMPSSKTILHRLSGGFSIEGPQIYRVDRRSIWITHDGETLPAPEWSRRLGFHRSTISNRIKAGMPLELAMTPHLFTQPI
jgi:hypothetical protein